MQVYKITNWAGQKNAIIQMQEWNQPKQENTLARLIE